MPIFHFRQTSDVVPQESTALWSMHCGSIGACVGQAKGMHVPWAPSPVQPLLKTRMRSRAMRSKPEVRQVCRSGFGLPAQVVVYQESSPIEDWRVQQMVDLCHAYFQELWTEGNIGVAEDVLDAAFVHHDEVWRKSKLVVGPSAFKTFVRSFREGYPDLVVRPVDFSTSDNTRVYVRWEAAATNLGRFRGREPTRHFSSISGITSFGFNHDRSRIKEAIVYRSPTAEEKEEWSAASDPLDVHLARLHFGWMLQ